MTTPRLRATLLAALLCAVAIAGCSGGGGPQANAADTGRIDQDILDDEGAGSSGSADGGPAQAAPGNGEIRGLVQDDAALPVAGALVSLLGTPMSATSGSDGRFRFANVTPGTHGLRVLADTDVYRVHEGEVNVAADRVTAVTVTLVPVDGRGPGYRPHLHDHWRGDTEVPLLDVDLDLPKMGTFGEKYGAPGELAAGTYSANAGTWWVFQPHGQRDDGRPSIVFPGTAQMRITVTWDDADVDADAFQMAYISAAAGNYRDLPAATNGATTTLELQPEDADNGHQGFSLWQFRIRPAPRTAPPNLLLGPIHVAIVLVKGPGLPVDPPHVDAWNGTTQLLLRDGSKVTSLTTVTAMECGDFYAQARLDDKRIVPPGTRRLSLRFHWEHSDAPGTPADGRFQLFWKPADQPPGLPFDEYVTADPATQSGTTLQYDLTLDPSQTDAFYQTRSNWVFLARRVDVRDAAGHCPVNLNLHFRYTLEVIAHKDPSFQ